MIEVLSKEFVSSPNSNNRKGGLIGLASIAIGLEVRFKSCYFAMDKRLFTVSKYRTTSRCTYHPNTINIK